MKKLVLSLMMGALALSSMEAQAYSPRSALQGSYNMLVNEVYPSNDYERLCKQRDCMSNGVFLKRIAYAIADYMGYTQNKTGTDS